MTTITVQAQDRPFVNNAFDALATNAEENPQLLLERLTQLNAYAVSFFAQQKMCDRAHVAKQIHERIMGAE